MHTHQTNYFNQCKFDRYYRGKTNERNQRGSTSTDKRIYAKNISEPTPRSAETTPRNSTEDTGNEIFGGNRETVSSSETVPIEPNQASVACNSCGTIIRQNNELLPKRRRKPVLSHWLRN